MASPSDVTGFRDQDAEPLSLNPSQTQEPGADGEDKIIAVNLHHSSPDKTLTLESAQDDPQNAQEPDESDARDQQPELSVEEGRNEEDDTEASATADMQVVSSSFSRRGGGPKRKKGNHKKRIQEKKSQEKLKVLVETLKPVPFVPVKTLDFSRHERLLKTLGLWDFVHLEFDQSIRHDLLAKLIAFYNPEGRCSHVDGARININRADLARALKLPKKKDRLANPDEEKDLLESDESIKFIEELVSTWVLLQGDDTWMMPKEVVEWERGIKEKQLDKLDWAGLFWFMVEKELKAEPPLGDCYYASHLQLLIRCQKEELLRERPKVEEDDDDDDDDDVKEVDVEGKDADVGVADLRTDDGAGDSKEEKRLEEHTIELNLGQQVVSEIDAEEEHCPGEGHHTSEEHHPGEGHRTGKEHQSSQEQLMDFEESKKEEGERWLWNENSNAGSQFLRQCDFGGSGAMECDEENKNEENKEGGEDEAIEDVEEEEAEEESEKHDGGFPLFPNGGTLDEVAQENLMLGDASPLGFSAGLQIHGTSANDFLASRADMHLIPGSSSLFGNGNKREIDHENDIPYHSHNPGSKRLRTSEPSWDDKPADFDMCMGQLQHWLGKARLLYEEKERACGESNVSQQILMNELHRREEMIQQLQRIKFEEQQRKDLEIYKLENELRMMASVLEGYRKALKETQKAFREHRERCPVRDKPIYKDVKGSGGLVLSAAEIEKQRLKQEEEDRIRRIVIEKRIKEFESGWFEKFEGHSNEVELLGDRLIEVENNVKLLKETFSKHKIVDTPECDAPTEA